MTQTTDTMRSLRITPTPARPARRVLYALGRSCRVLWALARIALILGAIGVAVAWRVYGYAPVAVQTGSMTPTFPVHTLLFVHDVPAADVRVGDVITFDPPGPVPRTTHRVVKRELHDGRWYFRTKGDGNPVADDWRQPGTPEALAKQSYVRGVSYSNGTAIRAEGHVKYVGWLAQLARVPHLRTALVGLPFLLLAIQSLLWIWKPGRPEDRMAEDEAAATPTEARPAA